MSPGDGPGSSISTPESAWTFSHGTLWDTDAHFWPIMCAMPKLMVIALVGSLLIGQGDPPPYVTAGDHVETAFRTHRDALERFFSTLRAVVAREAPQLLPKFQDPPPEPVRFGYGLLPRIVREFESDSHQRVSSFSYSWPITLEYIDGETQKLARVEAAFRQSKSLDPDALANFISEYLVLVQNQRTIDGYIQYNRFWQRTIASNRPRFDRMTSVYQMLVSGSHETPGLLEDLLGVPEVPLFVAATIDRSGQVVLRVPVYTDIEDTLFLESAAEAIERMWQTADSAASFAVEIQFRRFPVARLYPNRSVPVTGDWIDIADHASRFPIDGAVLTTGAEATHGRVGRYVALGPGDISWRTLAHEFGHVLGFSDGYVRGYRDLDQDGFEILELTTVFDDIMSAPREGRVLPEHYRMIVKALEE
jgi:hypothetical protein